jgi:hypothetical protein
MLDHVWTCACCGKEQRGLPLDFSIPAPAPWSSIPEGRREGPENRLDDDLCMIGGEDFFVRGCLELPIIGRDETFRFGLWTSLAKKNFERVLELWAADVSNEPPMFGWLCNDVTLYPPTFGLKTSVRLRNDNQRPAITLEPTDHPLALDQQRGVTMTKVEEMVAALLRH